MGREEGGVKGPLSNALRSIEFWRRSMGIYGSYKVAQLRATALRACGRSDKAMWAQHHAWAGEQMYRLAVDLRGFYLKAGQFIGSRRDFVPQQICERLSLLHDQVPPLPRQQAEQVLLTELGVTSLDQVFEWIDLDEPLGSASISQVHKAKLKEVNGARRKQLRQQRQKLGTVKHVVQHGEDCWSIANVSGVPMRDLRRCNKGVDLTALTPGQMLCIPVTHAAKARMASGHAGGGGGGGGGSGGAVGGGGGVDQGAASRMAKLVEGFRQRLDCRRAAECGAHDAELRGELVVEAAQRAMSLPGGPRDGLVAVKVQYPEALPLMSQDLGNLRGLAGLLSHTEIKFDLVSAVDELKKQIRLEFDFQREARVMDSIAQSLSGIQGRVEVPRSVPGMVTSGVLVMSFVEGIGIMRLRSRMSAMSPRKRRMAGQRLLNRISEAYGRMLLGDGLFQADGHPGNILVQRGGRIGLLDYGQSKQLSDRNRLLFAQLILDLNRGDEVRISSTMQEMGISTTKDDPKLRARMAKDMFDTTGRLDPFGKDSPIKQSAIQNFPRDMFFVLRMTQLLRGLANGMGLDDFSCASQWEPFAKRALRERRGNR